MLNEYMKHSSVWKVNRLLNMMRDEVETSWIGWKSNLNLIHGVKLAFLLGYQCHVLFDIVSFWIGELERIEHSKSCLI